jgi:hypothetical protein
MRNETYCGATLFVDHASCNIFLNHQILLQAGNMVLPKKKIERLAHEEGVVIKGYHGANVPFDSQEF